MFGFVQYIYIYLYFKFDIMKMFYLIYLYYIFSIDCSDSCDN